ncbi:diaminopimelate epimerase [Desulfonema ishimotonii]|uniref:Diaminopimelate epimerase n=1 Tax=Desulfonema ishimotonii TaxID=45657 RepID=A0A401FT96_9BACT|nr:diaminopimelate epimerase [Desulfonema ishimotonii]GBC60174.1 diaminopimelate epimerase [Desulfonema ishimotonii]
MGKIVFYKMSGSGNDFIIIDNRNLLVDDENLVEFIRKICSRKMSVGADGFILIEDSDTADFRWRFYNADGSVPEMCGNGARCAARFACLNGIAGPRMTFETLAGTISARVTGERVRIRMTEPADLKTGQHLAVAGEDLTFGSVDTGVPHAVLRVADADAADVKRLGRAIRFHERFAPAGTNVNFISVQEENVLKIRTYERGVEDETMACGTGAVAGAIVAARTAAVSPPVRVMTRGGLLTIDFREKAGRFCDVDLEGDARVVYNGELWGEAWKWE